MDMRGNFVTIQGITRGLQLQATVKRFLLELFFFFFFFFFFFLNFIVPHSYMLPSSGPGTGRLKCLNIHFQGNSR